MHTIEIVEPLAKSARQRLARLGYRNVYVYVGDGYVGLPEEAPFDVIILTASPPEIPQTLMGQLKNGGILVAPVGEYQQELVKLVKSETGVTRRTITYVRFVPMVHGEKK